MALMPCAISKRGPEQREGPSALQHPVGVYHRSQTAELRYGSDAMCPTGRSVPSLSDRGATLGL